MAATLSRLVQHIVANALLFVAASVLLFEEWLWDKSTTFAARLGKLPGVAQLEAWMRDRPPGQALALFALPVLVCFPLKGVALWALAHGDVAVGMAVFILAKVLATGVFARVYQLTEPALMTIDVLRRARNGFLRWRARMHAWLNRRPVYRRARDAIRAKSARIRNSYRAAYRIQCARRLSRARHDDRPTLVPSTRSIVRPRRQLTRS